MRAGSAAFCVVSHAVLANLFPMANSDLDVARVAHLARVQLSAEEAQLFQEQLAHVLEYADQLRAVDVSGVEGSAHADPIFNVFRDDEARAGFTTEEALHNAPQTARDLFLVTKVME